MIDMNKIGNYIKEERKKAGLTQFPFPVLILLQNVSLILISWQILPVLIRHWQCSGKKLYREKRRNNKWSQNIEKDMFIFKKFLPEQ